MEPITLHSLYCRSVIPEPKPDYVAARLPSEGYMVPIT